jgi:hypothetical protein
MDTSESKSTVAPDPQKRTARQRFRIRNTSLAGPSLASVTVPVKETHCERQKLVFRIQTSIDKEEDLSKKLIPE